MALVQSSHSISLPKVKTNRIPVVPHLIRDEDVIDNVGPIFKPLELDKIVKLFVDPHSSNLTDRHLHSIKKIIKHYYLGFVSKLLIKLVKKKINI